jgi:hypothetical protein
VAVRLSPQRRERTYNTLVSSFWRKGGLYINLTLYKGELVSSNFFLKTKNYLPSNLTP